MTDELVSWWPLLLVLATTRLVQLVMYDSILDGPRERIVSGSVDRAAAATWDGFSAPLVAQAEASVKRAWLAELLACVWCVSFWVSIVVAGVYAVVGHRALWVFLALSLSEVASILDRFVGRLFE